MKKQTALIIAFAIIAAGSAYAAEETFGPYTYDGGKISCNDSAGPEIKRWEKYKTTSDRFFKDDSISVAVNSGWGKTYSCSVSEVTKKKIKVKTDIGEVEIPVITDFTIYAHADCGSGLNNNPPGGGKTAAVECVTKATTVKYTNAN